MAIFLVAIITVVGFCGILPLVWMTKIDDMTFGTSQVAMSANSTMAAMYSSIGLGIVPLFLLVALALCFCVFYLIKKD